MKKLILGTVALSAMGLADIASAADMPLKAPISEAPVPYSWTGFYVGANAGYSQALDRSSMNSPVQVPVLQAGPETFNLQPGGVFGGLQAGYNWQFGKWVLGLETDIQLSSQKDNHTCVNESCFTNPAGITFFSTFVQQSMPWLGTTRARIGYAEFGPVMGYVTGGVAYGRVDTNITQINVSVLPAAVTNLSTTRVGWTVGTGVEAALGGNWSAKAEYLYIDFGTQGGIVNPTVFFFPTGFNSRLQENLFRGGLNYRFGGPGGTVATLTPTMNWTGFYVGANLGYALARNPSGNVEPFGVTWNEKFNLAPSGFLGGAQAGYNWQVAQWVLGVEADLDRSGQKDTQTCLHGCDLPNLFTAATVQQTMSWLGTARARLGYAVGPALFYATGGLAYGNVSESITRMILGASTNAYNFSHTKSGWTVGGGIERKADFFGILGPNWTLRTEYLYVDLGGVSDAYLFNGANNVLNSSIREHLWRSALSYKFGGDAVVTKY
jgi:outer membrane immunogenic protein